MMELDANACSTQPEKLPFHISQLIESPSSNLSNQSFDNETPTFMVMDKRKLSDDESNINPKRFSSDKENINLDNNVDNLNISLQNIVMTPSSLYPLTNATNILLNNDWSEYSEKAQSFVNFNSALSVNQFNNQLTPVSTITNNTPHPNENFHSSSNIHAFEPLLQILRHEKFGAYKIPVATNYAFHAISKHSMRNIIIRAYNNDVQSNFETAHFKLIPDKVALAVILEEFNNHRFDHHRDRYIILSELIADLFPGYYTSKEWYTPSNGSKNRADGFLLSAHSELKTLYVTIGAYGGSIRQAPNKRQSVDSNRETDDELLSIDKNITDVNDIVITKWTSFYHKRLSSYKKISLEQFCRTYENYLKFPSSLQLFTYDLDESIPNASLIFKEKWPAISQLIIDTSKKNYPGQFQTCSALCDVPEVLSLILLCWVIELPKGKTYFIEKKNPNAANDILSLFLFKTDYEDLNNDENLINLKQSIQSIYDKIKGEQKIQPIIVICGSYNNPKKIYLIIYEFKYECMSLIEAFITYLKLLMCFNSGDCVLTKHITDYLRSKIFDDKKVKLYKSVEKFERLMRDLTLKI